MKAWCFRMCAVLMLAGLLAPLVVVAQAAPDEPKTEQAPAQDPRTSVVDFRFEGLIFCDVMINGQGPFEMLFDSGATQSVLNKRLADKISLEQHDAGGMVQGVGEAEAKLAVVDSFEIGDFKRGKAVVAVMDFDHMSGSMGRHMWGIIGMNIIRFMENLTVDFSTNKLHMQRFKDGEEPSNMQEEMLIQRLEGGGMGGIPGLPDFPMPGRPDRQPERQPDRPDREEGEEDFFMPQAPFGAWKLMDGSRQTEAAPKRRSPREGMTLTYTTGTLSLPMLGEMELSPYWYVEAVINGQTKRFMFDTGASMMLVLDTKVAESMKIPTSFSYPVKGIGKGSADSGMVDSFAIGVVKAEDMACTILDLPKMSEMIRSQLGPLGGMIPGLDRLDFDGIIGVTLATRFKQMKVNTKNRTMEFVPYGDDEVNEYAPFETEDYITEAMIRTWNKQASTFGLDGDSVPLEEWSKHGLESGGLKISAVHEGAAAANAGLKEGDIITHLVGAASEIPGAEDSEHVDGEDVRVRDMPGLIMGACHMEPGSSATLRVKRGDEILVIELTMTLYEWEGTFPERFKR